MFINKLSCPVKPSAYFKTLNIRIVDSFLAFIFQEWFTAYSVVKNNKDTKVTYRDTCVTEAVIGDSVITIFTMS